MTVPRDVFERESGSFVFKVTGVFSLKSGEKNGEEGYIIVNSNCVHVDYEYIDEQTVLLSKPNSSIPR